jgi:hypothetical protein
LAGVTKSREKQIVEATSVTHIAVEDTCQTGKSEPQRLVEQIEERIDKLTATFQAELEKHKRELHVAHAKEAAHKAEAESCGGHSDESNALPTPSTSGDAEMGTQVELVAQARSERAQKLALLDTEPNASRQLETGECFADLPTWLASDLWRDERVQCALRELVASRAAQGTDAQLEPTDLEPEPQRAP